MNLHVFTFTLRRRLRTTAIAAAGLFAVIMLVCSLFPSVGASFGKLSLGAGAADLIGGGDFGTLSGWLNAEIFSIYGPAVIVGIAITGIVAVTAAEEEDGTLEALLSLPLTRVRVMFSKAGAVAITVVAIGIATWVGLVIGVAIAGGGIGAGSLAAQMLHMTMLALTFEALAFAIAAGTGKRTAAVGASVGVGLAAYLINGLAPTVAGLDWMQKLSPFYYYSGSDPLDHGLDVGHLAVLAGVALVLTLAGVVAVRGRDLRG